MRIIIVGNGLAGTISAKTLREVDQGAEIEIFAAEEFPYYPRPNLIEFLTGNIPFERVFAFPEKWYQDQNINIQLAKPVNKITPDSKEVEIEGGREKYDVLLLACGSYAFVPPFKGVKKQGVFTLRTLNDAKNIIEYSKDHQSLAVIGGGILGLETARAMKLRGAKVEVIEFFERLLPRQLDSQGASLLKAQIEKMGMKVHLGYTTEEILGQNEVNGLKFKGGAEIKTDMAIVAAGIRPNVQIAREAGLETDRGIVVNDYLQSSHPEIFAAGDAVQHKDRIYGIIPASFNQARMAALNILGQKELYEGTVPSNTLKVVGLDVTSIGLVNPEEGTCEELRREKKEEGVYKKLVIQNGTVIGAIWIGTKKGVNDINQAIAQKKKVEKWKDSLLDDDFDYSVL